MPLTGVSNPDGIYEEYMKFAENYGSKCDARFLYYFRQKRDLEAVIRLLNDSPHFIGVKIGTDEEDVQPLIEGVGDSGNCDVGYRWTGVHVQHNSAQKDIRPVLQSLMRVLQTKSITHSDGGDYETSAHIEADIAPLEEIRFMNERVL